jgi:hypothetical protein
MLVISVMLSFGAAMPLRSGGSVRIPWAGPVVAVLRHPFRLNILIGLSVSILAAQDLASLLEAKGPGRRSQLCPFRSILITAIVAAVVLFEYLAIPFPTKSLRVPSFYLSLAGDEGDFALVEIPIGRQADKYSMYFQTLHEKPIVGGVVSRTPPQAYGYIKENKLLHVAWQGDAQSLSSAEAAESLTQLVEDGVRYVVLKKYLLEASAVERWRAVFQGPQAYEDDMVVAYRVADLLDR